MGIVSKKTQGNAMDLKKEQTISAILMHPTLVMAAQSLGINEATLWRRMQDDDLQSGLQDAKRRVYQQSLLRLQTIVTEAIDTLAEVMNNKLEAGSTRVSAARTLLEASSKAVESDELKQRIESLERLLERQP